MPRAVRERDIYRRDVKFNSHSLTAAEREKLIEVSKEAVVIRGSQQERVLTLFFF
jgi:hypothetical protein